MECWLWGGSFTPRGYGRLYENGAFHLAHRYVYEQLVGPIPPGLVIDHLCRNPPCVNPRHLEAVTQSVNTLRGHNQNRAKTHCPQGHEYSMDNTYINPRGGRICHACKLESLRRYRSRILHARAS